MRVLAIANQKGGVGKTTTAVNLSAAIAEQGHRVLLIDLDPQGNATMSCGMRANALQLSVYDCLLGRAGITDARVELSAHWDMVPATMDLIAAEKQLWDVERREYALSEALLAVRDRYALVFMDCPPSLTLLTLNALVAAEGIIIPVQCEYFALEGLAALWNTIDRVRARLNPDLDIFGVLRTMHDPRNSLTLEVSRQLAEAFGERMFDTVIPRNVRLAEAPSHGVPIIEYERHSRGGTGVHGAGYRSDAQNRTLVAAWQENSGDLA